MSELLTAVLWLGCGLTMAILAYNFWDKEGNKCLADWFCYTPIVLAGPVFFAWLLFSFTTCFILSILLDLVSGGKK